MAFSRATMSPVPAAASKRSADTGGSLGAAPSSHALSSERTEVVPTAITRWPAALVACTASTTSCDTW